MDEFIGTIKIFAGNFDPQGWLSCDGRLLSVQEFPILSSIIGSIYGGDGVTCFALPDLKNAVPKGTGWGPGCSPVTAGEFENLTTHGTQNIRTLGVRYIICVDGGGIYPTRD